MYTARVNLKVKVSVEFANQIFKLVLKSWNKKGPQIQDRGKQKTRDLIN